MADVSVAGRRLELRAALPGDPRHPTIVFLHEGLGCASAWRSFPDRLASTTGCGIIVYSRWGYGSSEPRHAPWPLDFLEAEAQTSVPAVLDVCGLPRAVLFGHSDGGTIALLTAAAYPDRVQAVITEAAHVMVEDVTVVGLGQLRQRFESGDLRPGLQRLHGERADHVFNGWAGVWQDPAFRAWDIRRKLATMTCPVLALQGELDEFGSPSQLQAIAAAAGGPVDTWVVPECGHVPHRDQPDAILHRAAAFIGRLGRQPSMP